MLKRLLFFLLISAVSSFGALILIIPPDGGEPTFADYDKLPNGKIIINGITYEDGSQGIPSVGGGTYYILPDLLTDAPTTNFPVGFAAYQESTNTVAPNANVPEISEWIRQGNRGDALALTGENLDASNAWFIASSGETNGYACDVLKMAGQEAAIKLSPSLAYKEMYLVWPYNSNGFGRPFPVNRTEVWRVGWDKVTTADQFSLYGQNLIYGNGDCYAYCVEEDEWLTSVSANPYKATFDVPDTWTDGDYTIVGHNGRGRKYGFATPRTLTVYSELWSEDTNTWTSVLSYDPDANDGVSDAGPAIDYLLDNASAGDTIYFPDGTYAIRTRVTPGHCPNVRMIGESRDGTILIPHEDFSATNGAASMMVVLNGPFEVQDMTLAVGDGFLSNIDANYPYVFQASKQLKFTNVLFDQRPAFQYKQLVYFDVVANALFTNCTYIISRPPSNNRFITNMEYTHCDFYGIQDCNGLLNGAGATGIDVNNCTAQDYANIDTNNYFRPYGKGRFLTLDHSDMLYYGDNQVIGYEPNDNYLMFSQSNVTSVGTFGTPYNDTRTGGLGTVAELTLNFASISNRWDGFGDSSIDYAGCIGNISLTDSSTMVSYVKTLDADTGEVVFRVKSNQFSKTNLLDSAEDMIVDFDVIVDQNSGEMVMWENDGGQWREEVSSATATSVTVQANHYSAYGQPAVGIISGRGFGQVRNVSAWAGGTTNTPEAIITEPWNVIPDTTSVIVGGRSGNQGVIYNSLFEAEDPTRNTASCSVQAWGGVHTLIMDGNTVRNNESGMTLWNRDTNFHTNNLSGSPIGLPNVQPFTAFCLIQNNVFTNHSIGVVHVSAFEAKNYPDNYADVGFVGNVFRQNEFDLFGPALNYSYNIYTNGLNHTGLTIYDRNDFTGYSDLRSMGSTGFVNQVFIGNTSDGTNAIQSAGSPVVWYDNEFTDGFSSNYYTLTIPQPVVTNVTEAAYWDTGTTQTVYTASNLVVGVNDVVLGTQTNTITVLGESTEDPVYYAMFNGTDDNVTTGLELRSAPAGGTNAFTWEVEFATTNASYQDYLFTDSTANWGIRIGSPGTTMSVGLGGWSDGVNSWRGIPVDPADFRTFTAAFDGVDELTVSTNGVEYGSTTLTGVGTGAIGFVRVGSKAGANYFDGKLYSASMTSTPFSWEFIPAESNGLWEVESETFYPNLGTGDLSRQTD